MPLRLTTHREITEQSRRNIPGLAIIGNYHPIISLDVLYINSPLRVRGTFEHLKSLEVVYSGINAGVLSKL